MKQVKQVQEIGLVFHLIGSIILFFTSCVSEGQTLMKHELKLIGQLPEVLHETSGLACDTLYGNIPVLRSHNDKGAGSVIYTVDASTAQIVNTLHIQGIENKDWEDLTQNDSILFIGDTGNNKGKRSDFKIYALPKRQFGQLHDTVLFDGYVITYVYPNQLPVTKGEPHNYDAEAITFNKGFIYVFSKNRKDDSTVIYRLKDKAGFQVAERIGAFEIGFLVTSATYYKGNWYVLGYQKKGNCELVILQSDLVNPAIVSKRVLGSFKELGQLEAVCIDNAGNLFISAEAVDGQPAKLYRMKL